MLCCELRLWILRIHNYVLVAILCLSSLPLCFAYSMRPDLSGVWIPDGSRSTFHRTLKAAPGPQTSSAPAPADSVYRSERIDQKGGTFTISTLDENEQVIGTLVLSADGIEAVNEIGAIKHRSVTLWQGNKLVTEWTEERAGEVVRRGKDARELSEDESTLTLRKRTDDSASTTESVVVFTKKAAAQ